MLPSVCASGTNTSSSARPVSRSVPSGSSSSYSPSSTVSGPITATGITASPVRASWAFDHGVRSSPKTSGSTCPSSACWRARIESGSLRRGHLRSSIASSDRKLDVADVEPERLAQTHAVLDVLLQHADVGLVHQPADHFARLGAPERVLHEDRQEPVPGLDQPLFGLLIGARE